MKPTGYVIYRGPSMLDGAPIVAIATMKTDNRKTGDMVQTWILRADMGPVDASKAGADASICGDCPHRWHTGGACYVNIGHGPLSVWRAWKRTVYPQACNPVSRTAIGAGRRVRLGAYGDPAAVPDGVWRALIRDAVGHTGYTHQWRTATALRDLCMASVDSAAELAEAQRAGWRTFRITGPTEILEPAEILCAAEATGRTCADCMACDGATRGTAQASVAITVHGSRAVRFQVRPVAVV